MNFIITVLFILYFMLFAQNLRVIYWTELASFTIKLKYVCIN